ncbi:ferredoxin [endosymbiont 'TC1' of Trimyema compressum]|uniref:ferredoxin n=1 Tax=endosymbiont 'TC1' of Trimyema compressum TaxID=243899 RepID=UPI0007F0ECF7|nr:ferredoxin [endosymbiont 'TC1' of Trimyema compressum]AMP20544.1 ferredoxin [endosymbiont 'TC1' of Trimyema compressum]
MKSYVDKGTCIGCESCVNECPEIFFMDDEGLAEAKDVELTGVLLEKASEVEEVCPVEAISIK